ncbi:helix-turn-helix domain-containing protein [Photobacterium arenosum]|uniref:helix-turn-helix domain-containing protein n=1 Tax=Photobacterium arenosum TaxID=2774143 RepID=UPI002889731D|nr:helix-turn-helix transcriptional regulator [Photobacterium arenosum]
MTYTIELLNMVKAKYSLETDYQVAKKLGVTSSRVSNWMRERNAMDWDVAFKVADLLDMDDQNVVYGLLQDKYENPRLINVLKAGCPA